VLATLTTNFVNIYMSSLAWKSLFPRTSDSRAIWSIGLIGTALSALPGVWLDQYSNFMVVLGALLVPVGGVLIAHFYLPARDALVSSSTASVSVLYDADGPLGGFVIAGVAAWALGALAFFAAGSIGGTLPSLVVSMGVYVVLTRVRPSKRPQEAFRGAVP
jgi:purine-cytosine permease-like protein